MNNECGPSDNKSVHIAPDGISPVQGYDSISDNRYIEMGPNDRQGLDGATRNMEN